jgi:putative tryptophan/tyrosine transport system substrate-binding protein
VNHSRDDDVPAGMSHNIEREAQTLGVQLQRVDVGTPEALDGALAALVQMGADAILLSEGPPFGGSTLSQILAFARQHRLPTSSGGRHNATAGVLLAYGAHAHDLCQRSAVFVDKILKGVTPADLPVERAHKFEFIVNLTTAKSLGLTLPPTLLFQADEVLQ